MVAVKELPDYINAQYTLMYTAYKDFCRTYQSIKTALRKQRNVFLWTPNELTCLSLLDADGKPNKDATDAYNLIQDLPELKAELGRSVTKNNLPINVFLSLLSKTVDSYTVDYNYVGSTIPPKSVIIMAMLDNYLGNPEIDMRLISLITEQRCANYGITLIGYSPYPIDNRLLTQYGIKLEIDSFSDTQTASALKSMAMATPYITDGDRPKSFPMNSKMLKMVVDGVHGLAPCDVYNTLALCLYKHPLTESAEPLMGLIDQAKIQAISSEILTYVPPGDTKYIGGFENFIEFMAERAVCFTEKAQELNLDRPRGVVLTGLPGTAKSLAAKSLGCYLHFPTIIMNVGAAFGQYVGESEGRIRQALAQVDALDGCILVVDEADKLLAGDSSATASGGDATTGRVKGALLTWLAEHKSRTFVVFTMNDTQALKSEFLRAGRFDRIFYTDLPCPEERKEIILLQLEQRGVARNSLKVTDKEWSAIISATDNFSGAELVEVVKDARLDAFRDRESGIPNGSELLKRAKERTPMAVADPRVMQLRKESVGTATPASKPRVTVTDREPVQRGVMRKI